MRIIPERSLLNLIHVLKCVNLQQVGINVFLLPYTVILMSMARDSRYTLGSSKKYINDYIIQMILYFLLFSILSYPQIFFSYQGKDI